MTKMAMWQGLVTIDGLPGYWAAREGGNITADATPVWDGGVDYPDQLASRATAENVTLSRPVDDERDLALLRKLRREVSKMRATITHQYTNSDLFPIGEPLVYPGALLVTYNEPSYDAANGDAQVIQLVFAIGQYV